MNAFLKDNIALVAAIVLPLVLAIFFGLSTLMMKVSVEDPKNDFFVVTDYYEGNSDFSFDVNNERLNITWKELQKDAQGNTMPYSGKPRLWRVNAPEMSVQEISLNEPGGSRPKTISIPGVTDIKVINLMPGPDGYEFVDTSNYGGNLMTEIFASDRNRDSLGIAKNGRLAKFKIPGSNNNYYYYNTQFLGWVAE